MENSFYRSFSGYLRERFGQRVFRVSLDAGFTCPTRDGTLGSSGCAYCSEHSSWSGRGRSLPLREQVELGKEAARRRYGARSFIAYFQSYTGTYADVNTLRSVYDSVLSGDSDFVALAIGTRPDCIDREKLALIAKYIERGLEVWIEYGLQSAKNETLRLIGRGHTAEDFSRAVLLTKEYGIKVSAHVILGLPGESGDDMNGTAAFLSSLPVDGIKIHNLNIVDGTRCADWFREGKVKPLTLVEYARAAVDFLERSRPDAVIERLIAETNPRWLLAPLWTLDKHNALQAIYEEFKKRDSFQGKLFPGVKN